MESDFRHATEAIRREIEELLQKSGILFRAFGRGKSTSSIKKKLDKNLHKYRLDGKLIQDAVGIRIALYFFEDTPIVEKLLKDRYDIEDNASTIDRLGLDQFNVSRHNLVFRPTAAIKEEMERSVMGRPIDTTFEVQLRSILSEGWHEVDHDLRYKCKDNWMAQPDLDRALNGILATLETSEWSMKKIFDDLAYRHYKLKNWPAMLHSKFRMRANPELSKGLTSELENNNLLAKEILRVSRSTVIYTISKATPKIPINLDNILLIANCVGPNDSALLEVTPKIILEAIGHPSFGHEK